MVSQKQPVDWVDPLIDTANRRFLFMTTASHPFGLVNLSPDTRVGGGPWDSGYRYDDDSIRWFSHVHAWQLCGVPVMPTTGPLKGHLGSDHYKSGFKHADESAQPGYHAVRLDDYGIRAELTATCRVGFHRYTFDAAGDAWIVFGLGEEIMLPMSDVSVRRDGLNGLTGYVENEGTRRRKKRATIHFQAVFDRNIEEIRAWRKGEFVDFEESLSGPDTGIAVRFKMDAGEALLLKVALSYCDVEGARRNLETELPHWDFDRVRQETRDTWNTWLSRIEVEGGTEARKTKFYTDLLHALKGRRRVSDVDGRYMDNTGASPIVRQIPSGPDGLPLYEHHNSDAFWGGPWSLNLLWALAWPGVTHNFCNTLIDYYRNGGLIPRGPSGGNYTYVMTSPTSTTFLVSAWTQGIRSFDINLAYEGMLKNHGPGGLMSKAGYEHDTCIGGGVETYLERGYVPMGIKADAFHVEGCATMTLEYAYHDWALAQLAGILGHEDDEAELTRRALSYRTIWNEKTGYMQPRKMDGQFTSDFDPMEPEGWVEGNGHHYRWYVPHNVADLIRLFGGREAFIRELDGLFQQAEATDFIAPHGSHHANVMDYGNQPCMYLAHLFSYAGAPWLTQKWVRRVMDASKSDITPYGGFGGDEDQGEMGCLNALMAIGLFNVQGGCNADPIYEITSPVFDRVTIHLDPAYHSGGTFVIETENNGPGDRYIQSAELNGTPLDRPWFHQRELAAGGKLKIILGTEPNKTWGSAPGDAPPSMDAPGT